MNGIVTFHDGINYGAYLQVYALQKYLNSIGIDNEVINYKNKKHWFNEYKCFIYTKNPKSLINNIIKIYKFRQSQKRINKTRFFKDFRSIKFKKYDAIFYGSDEIWNYKIPLFGEDLFYFGQGMNAEKYIAYAVSFGNISFESNIPEHIRQMLNNFSSISVRDENSYKIIDKNINKKVLITLDPTLLYDFSGEETDCPYDDFIMFYSVGVDNETQNKVKEYARLKNKKLISVGWKNNFCDLNKIAINPFEFLGYIKKASEIITSMYHGTLFSIKYKKKFCILMDPYRKNKLSILKTLGLENRLCRQIENINEIMKNEINYNNVYKILNIEKEKSVNYIKQSIKN